MVDRLTEVQATLVKNWMSMARGVAKNFWERSDKQLPLDELISTAYHGLVQAAVRFEPDRPGNDERYEVNAGFGQYAKQRVVGAILDWQRSQDHVPRRQRQTYKKLQDHGHGTGRSPEELADLIGLPVDRVRAIVFAVESGAVSLDEVWESNESESGARVESSVVANHITDTVAEALSYLPPIQRSIFARCYYLAWTPQDTAADLGLPVSTVRSMLQEIQIVLTSVMRNASHT